MARSKLTPQEQENRKIISENLQKLLYARNIKQNDLSERVGIPLSTLNGYIRATSTPTAGNLEKLADFFEVNKSDIDPRYAVIPGVTNIVEISSTVKIPVLGTIACGDPILAVENIEDYIEEPSNSLPHGELFYLKTKGDSMSPTINDGSLVLLRKQETCENGEIAAVLINGDTEATLKRIKRQGSFTMLIADNPNYEPIIVDENNPARIIGKAMRITTYL